MTGEFNIKKFGLFLKSFWGLLASFSVILPTLIYFLNTTQIKSSVLSEYYIGIPTTFALLVIPFTFLFEDKFSVLKFARKTSISFSILSLITLFSFLVIKNIYITNTYYAKSSLGGYGRIEIREDKYGNIEIQVFDESAKNPKSVEQRTNILELVSLVFYTISIILLTAAFSGLGVFYYTKT